MIYYLYLDILFRFTVYDLLFQSAGNDRITNSFDRFVGIRELLQVNRLADVHVYRVTAHERLAFRQHLKTAVQRKRNTTS